MPGWLGGLLVVGAIFGAVFGWETLKERLIDRGGKAGKAAEVLDATQEAVGGGIHSILQKGGGLVMGALGIWALYSLATEGFAWWRLGGLALIAYAVYLLWPGRRSFWIF